MRICFELIGNGFWFEYNTKQTMDWLANKCAKIKQIITKWSMSYEIHIKSVFEIRLKTQRFAMILTKTTAFCLEVWLKQHNDCSESLTV